MFCRTVSRWRSFRIVVPARRTHISSSTNLFQGCRSRSKSEVGVFGKRSWVGKTNVKLGGVLNLRASLHTSTVSGGKVVAFNLPDVGEGIQTVEVKEWLVSVGDTVALGDPVCEAQSDKSSATIHVPYDGVIKQLMYEVGDTATLGNPILMMEIEGEGEDAPAQEEPSSSAPSPSSSEDIQAAPAVRKLAQENSVNLGEVKGTGKNGRILKEDVLNFVESVSTKVSDIVGAATTGSTLGGSEVRPSGKVLTTPAIRHMAKEKGVDLSEVQGTGDEGRVLKEDLLRYIVQHSPADAIPKTPPPLEGDRTEPIKGFKAVMVKTMDRSGRIPQFGYCDEIDMTRLVSLRASFKEQMEREGLRFSYMPVLIKAISLALTDYPTMNAHVNDDCTAITLKVDHNIGIAMDTPEGLVVPNIKQVQSKSILEITTELNRLHDLGLKGKLPPADTVGGTFSLSNIGAIGGTYARPILLPPEVAIGAFGKVATLPRFKPSGELYSAHVMQVSWSADHRVIDGATCARFSNKWKSLVEEPAAMILELR